MNTHVLGDTEIQEEATVRFEQGIPGFERFKSWVILLEEENPVFAHLQSVEESEIGFLLANPFSFYPDYQFQLPAPFQEELRLENENDVEVWTIVTVGKKIEDCTLNLAAPVIVNKKLKLGKQLILQNTSYQTKHFLIQYSADLTRPKE